MCHFFGQLIFSLGELPWLFSSSPSTFKFVCLAGICFFKISLKSNVLSKNREVKPRKTHFLCEKRSFSSPRATTKMKTVVRNPWVLTWLLLHPAQGSVFQFSSELLSGLQQIIRKSFHSGNYSFSAVGIEAWQFSPILASVTFKDFFRVGSHRSESIHRNCHGPKVCNCHLEVKQEQMVLSVFRKFLMGIRHKTKTSLCHHTPVVLASPNNF